MGADLRWFLDHPVITELRARRWDAFSPHHALQRQRRVDGLGSLTPLALGDALS